MSTFLRGLALVAPATAVVLALPLALGPFAGDPRGFFGPYFLAALPVWVAVLAAPGYLAALLVEQTRLLTTTPRRWWVRASLVAAAFCSLAGIIGTYWMFLFLPPSLVSLASTLVLLVRSLRPHRHS
jgi:hypothetical protein